MGSRTLPYDCPHGVTLDWGDFGPDPDDGTVGAGQCEQCTPTVLTPDETVAYIAAHPEVAERARQLAAEHTPDGAA